MLKDASHKELSTALAYLTAGQNSDGGWGYKIGGMSYAEPSCYALLALTQNLDTKEFAEKVNRALQWFTQHTNQAGAISFTLPEKGTGDIATLDNWGTILASFTWRKLSSGEELAQRYLKYTLSSYGNRIDKKASEELRLNGDLQAWSWARGTASWVEPTAYAILSLKASQLRNHERVKVGENFLLDRACYEGGWNYGNKEVLRVNIEPMPTNTCFALLALQDLDRNHPVIKKSVEYLDKELSERQSSLALALGILSLQIYDRPVHKLLDQLLARQQENGSWRDNHHLTALAVLALQAGINGKNIFKLDSSAQGK